MWTMCIENLKQPKLTLDLRLLSCLYKLTAKHKFIRKPQSVAASITKVGKGDQQWTRQAETYSQVAPYWCGTTQLGIQGYFLINVNIELKKHFKRHLCCIFISSYCFTYTWKIYSQWRQQGSKRNLGFFNFLICFEILLRHMFLLETNRGE